MLNDLGQLEQRARHLYAPTMTSQSNGHTIHQCELVRDELAEARERMHAPQGVAPRGEIGLDGKMHRISVDGGQGGDLDEVLSTLATIGQALDKLKAYAPRAHEVVVWVVRDGKSLSDLEQPTGLSAASVSRERDRGFAYLAGVWAGSGLLR
jgi:uncharacterized protein YerC